MARKKRKWGERWKRVRRWVVVGFAGFVLLYLALEILLWPDIAELKAKRPESTAFIERYEDRYGKKALQKWVPYSQISMSIKHAALAGEDIGFLHHDGFEAAEIQDALKDAVLEGKSLRGASTITQQLAKNLWLSPSRNPLRNVKEAILTQQLEENLSKKRILEIYLNVVELGPGIFGVEAASQHWFGVSAADLGEDDAIALIAMLPAPKKRTPSSTSESYRKHRDAIRRRMSRSMHLRERL